MLGDPLFWIFVLPGLLLGMYAQGRIKANVTKYSQLGTLGGITGAQVARELLDSQGLQSVAIDSTPGILSDHLGPRRLVVIALSFTGLERLPPDRAEPEGRSRMRLWLSLTALVVLFSFSVSDNARTEPLVTIHCDKPNGFNIAYGTTLQERFEATQKKKQPPSPKLSGPNKDGYRGTPTFVVASNKKQMTVIWSELSDDMELRKRAKEFNLPTLPPPAASEARVVLFLDDQISAIEAVPWSISTYSFFPILGTAFISQQWMQPGSKSTTQLATFARCEFSWSNPNDDPRKNR